MNSFVSGNFTGQNLDIANKTKTRFFRMDLPVQAYLIAVAAGDLAEEQVGPRTYVITEPEDLERCAKEFEDLEDSLVAAENYLTHYEWGVYKILILPPSFPYGGMENPLLTFATPQIVTGDKSNIFIANHEIAHSWTGNLVTNQNWSNFWLNEGFTVFVERKITEALTNDTVITKIATTNGNSSMYHAMEGYGLDSNYSSLTPQSGYEHPDDAFSTIPYEKGSQFLNYLESLVGEEPFQRMLQTYINKYQRQSIVVAQFISHWEEFVNKEFGEYTWKAQKIIAEVDWDTWVHSPGLPPVQLDYSTFNQTFAETLALKYVEDASAVTQEEIDTLNCQFWSVKTIFINVLNQHRDNIDADLMALIEKNHEFSKIQTLPKSWYPLAIYTGYFTSPFEIVDEFLSTHGSMGTITPQYVALDQSGHREDALRIYEKNLSFYHPIAIDNLDKALNIGQE